MNDSIGQSARGILPAIVSPHRGDDGFDAEAFEEQAGFLLERGVQGLYVCGGTGEGYLMRAEERRRAAEIAARVFAGRGLVMVHVGAQSSRDAAELAEHAARAGAGAVASIPPAGRSLEEVAGYYRDIAAASGLPAFVYHIPALTHERGDLARFRRLLDVPGVVGMKFSDSDLYLLSRLKRERPEAIVFNGSDELLLPGLMYGASGGIGTWYNLIPEVFVGIWRKAEGGDFAGARKLQEAFLRLADLAWSLGLLETFDLLMRRRGRVKHVFRRPFIPFTPEREAEVLPLLEPVREELGIAL